VSTRAGGGVVTLGECARAFWRQPSPPYLLGAVALVLGLRLAQGSWSWRNHRLHHFKNERYWFGVTSTVGDRVIGTLPDQSTVPRSPTARSLGDQPSRIVRAAEKAS